MDAPAARKFSVGLTGGIGSGKTTVADMFQARGAALIDTDRIAHALTAAGGAAMPEIDKAFGTRMLRPDGSLDRVAMRTLVFSDPSAKGRLESILHPLIRRETEEAAARAEGAYQIFVVPLLVESGSWKERVSRVLVVDCPEQLQIARVMARSSLSRPQVEAIMSAQVSRDQRLAAADDVILNDGDVNHLLPQVDRLHALYLRLTAASS